MSNPQSSSGISQAASEPSPPSSQVEKLREELRKAQLQNQALTNENRALHIAKSNPVPKIRSSSGRKAQVPAPAPIRIQLDDEAWESEFENDDSILFPVDANLIQPDSEPANPISIGSGSTIASASPLLPTIALSNSRPIGSVPPNRTISTNHAAPLEIDRVTGLPSPLLNELKIIARKFGAMYELFMPITTNESFYNQCPPSINANSTVLPSRLSANPEDRQLCLLVSLYNGVPEHLQPLIRNHFSFRLVFEPSIRDGRKHSIFTLRQCIGTIYSLPADVVSSASAREESILINQLLKWTSSATDPPNTPPFACPSGREDGGDIFRERRLALCGLALLKGPAAAKRIVEGIQKRVSSPPTNCKRWGVTSVTEGFIVCVFILVWFTLSNDVEFTPIGANSGIEYEELYHYHRDLLARGRNMPAIQATLAFWNSIIFTEPSTLNNAQATTSSSAATQAARRRALTAQLAKLQVSETHDVIPQHDESVNARSPTQMAASPGSTHANSPTEAVATLTAHISTTMTNPPPTVIQATASIEISSSPVQQEHEAAVADSQHEVPAAPTRPQPVPRKRAPAPAPVKRTTRRTAAGNT
ncbi:hypothetical protein BD779DRAFT_1674066 [Infundibulicybe gibba]|nr:hypothetical protein BD779DRAFT_1674066 [Infundibulicybe gibba]